MRYRSSVALPINLIVLMVFEPYRAALARLHAPFDQYANWRKQVVVLKLSRPAAHRLEWMIWYETKAERRARRTCRHFGIAPKTFYLWQKRFGAGDVRALEDRSRAPHRRRVRTITSEQEERILTLRRTFLRYGKEKLARRYAEEYGEPVSSWHVQKVIEKHRLYYHPAKNARTQAKRRCAEKKKRIAELPLIPRLGFLFRIDTVVRYWHGVKRYILTAVDTTSRLAFAHMYTRHSSETAADFLRRLYLLVDGRIENVQTDNGSEFHGAFERAASSLALAHYWSRVHTPKDNAMNERFNRTMSEEFIQLGNRYVDPHRFNERLTEWLVEYNFRRAHQALGYLSPINFIQKHEKLLPMYPSSTRH